MNFLTQYQRHPSLDPYVSACQSTDSFGVVYRAHEMYTFFLSLHGSLTDAIDDVIKDAERYHKIRDMDFKKFTALGAVKKYGDLNFDDTVDAI